MPDKGFREASILGARGGGGRKEIKRSRVAWNLYFIGERLGRAGETHSFEGNGWAA